MPRDLIIRGDCLKILPSLSDNSFDMILSDLPYGVTQNSWDEVIPLAPLWREYRRVAKLNAPVVLTSVQPFAAQLIMSNPREFRYDLIWRKNRSTGFLNANRMPLRQHETILVFYRRLPVYHPQKTAGHKPVHTYTKRNDGSNYGETRMTKGGGQTDRHPTSVLDIAVVNNDSSDRMHPNQKPVELFEYLIRTFSEEGSVVLDSCIGSGTTAIACINTNRHYVGIELDDGFYSTANDRVEKHLHMRGSMRGSKYAT